VLNVSEESSEKEVERAYLVRLEELGQSAQKEID